MNNSTYELVPIGKIELDIENPRIAKYIEIYGGNITAEQMSLALGAADPNTEENSTTFVSLRESIKTHGGIIHPIIVNRQKNGKLTAIEGNTRVLIYQEFKERGVRGNWDSIPAMVYECLDSKGVEAIRLQAHLVGPRPWDPYSKAKYISMLSDEENLTIDQIVDFCGGKKKEVMDYINAYHDVEKYYRGQLEDDDQFDATRFSAFVELQRPRIQQALIRAKFDRKDFAKWVIDDLIYPLNRVRQLPLILDNDESRKVFLKDGAEAAMRVLEAPAPNEALEAATLEQLLIVAIQKISSLRLEQLKELQGTSAQRIVGVLFDAKEYLDWLCDEIQKGREDNG